MDFDKDKILSRVKKMMALANDAGASEGERDNAIRMAHATLAKYNLTMAEAERAGTKPEEKRTGEPIVGRDFPWCRTTAYAIAQLFFCEYFYISQHGGTVKHFFIGKTSNVYTAQEMSRYVIDSITKEAHRVSKERTGSTGGTFWRSFCKGAASTIWHRCAQLRAEAEKASVVASTGTSLVLASVYASEKVANTHFLTEVMGMKNLRASKARERNTSYDAHAAGREYGSKVNLNRQIGGGGSNQQRLK